MSDSPVPTGNIEPQKNIEITANGNYEVVPDDHYRGIAKVGINVFVDESGQYASGYTSGYTDGYASGTTDGYNSGYNEGEEAQKNKLSAVTITENGQYNRPDGYSAVTVNVSAPVMQNKNISATTNGTFSVTADQGYDGLNVVNVDVNVTGGSPYLITKEYNLPVSPTIKATDDFNKVEFGVIFGKYLSEDSDTFAEVCGLKFCVTSFSLWVEYDGQEIDLYYYIDSGTTYPITIDTYNDRVRVNGEYMDDGSRSTWSGQAKIGNSGMTMNLSYFNYYTSSGVDNTFVTDIVDSGISFSNKQLKPALEEKIVRTSATAFTISPSANVYGISGVTVYCDPPIVPSWKNYQDDTFKYVREDCTNDGTYMCHIIDFDLSKYGAVDIVNGEITGATYQNMYQISNGHWYGTPTYNNVTYWLECWVDNGKLYWFCPNAIISRLDAYETGSNRQGWYLP